MSHWINNRLLRNQTKLIIIPEKTERRTNIEFETSFWQCFLLLSLISFALIHVLICHDVASKRNNNTCRHVLTTPQETPPDGLRLRETPTRRHARKMFPATCQETLPDDMSWPRPWWHKRNSLLTTCLENLPSTCYEPRLSDKMSRTPSWQCVRNPFGTTCHEPFLDDNMSGTPSWQHVKTLFVTTCHEPFLDDNLSKSFPDSMSRTSSWQHVMRPVLTTTCQEPLSDNVSGTRSWQHVRNPFLTACHDPSWRRVKNIFHTARQEPLPDNMSDPHLKACFEPFPRDVSGTPSWRNVVFLLRTLSGEMVGTCSWQYIHIYIEI